MSQHDPESLYTDHESLMDDFQSLLSDINLSDTSILVYNHRRLALHSQILRARSTYFAAYLSPPWIPSTNLLNKPNVHPDVFQDLIEFLMTGTISLSVSAESIPHNLSLACLAHEVACEELETILIQHINHHMTLDNISLYIYAVYAMPTVIEESGLQTPPPLPSKRLEDLFINCLLKNITQIHVSLAAGEWLLMRTLWSLLANAFTAGDLHNVDVTNAVRAILEFSQIENGRVLNIQHLLQNECPKERNVLLSFLLAAPPLMFKQYVEPRGFFTSEQLLEKYRTDAIKCPRATPRRKSRPKYRVLCESDHPYKSGARLDLTIRKVVLPGDQGTVLKDTLILFDQRSCLGGGAELNFYIKDPRSGAHPYSFCIGRDLHPIVLPGSEFWYAFVSPVLDDEYESSSKVKNLWGWRFFAEAIAPEIDSLD